jgi:DNA polymerase IV
MRLNQKGLYEDVKRGHRGEKLNEGVLVEGRSEKRIFEILGVPWREPHERIC